VTFPCLSSSSCRVVELVTLAQTSRLLAGGGETTRLPMLVHRLDDPVDARVATNSFVLRIDQYHFIVLVCRILIDPV